MALDQITAFLGGLAAVFSAAGFLIIALRVRPRIDNVAGKVDAVHSKTDEVLTEVKTINGATIAELIEGTENRRLSAQKPHDTEEGC